MVGRRADLRNHPASSIRASSLIQRDGVTSAAATSPQGIATQSPLSCVLHILHRAGRRGTFFRQAGDRAIILQVVTEADDQARSMSLEQQELKAGPDVAN
jgi:hypothetical protein